jgi:hypothetical protein
MAAILAVFLTGIIACAPRVFAENAAPSAKPDVLILVNAQMQGSNWVSITYPGVVQHSMAQANLSTLASEAGWQVSNASITDESVMANGKDPMTSVQFMTPQVVNPTTNILLIEPVIKAYKNYKNIQLIYIVSPNARLRAMGSYENKYVAITFTGSTGTYRYGIHVKDSSFESLKLPVPAAATTSGAAGNGQNTALRIVVTVLIVLHAIGTAILAFVFTSRATAGRGGTKSS